MKKLLLGFGIVTLLFLAGCDSINTDQFTTLEDNMETDFAALETQLETEITGLETELIEELTDLELALTGLETEITSLEEDIVALQTELAAIEDYDDSNLIQEISALETAMADLLSQLTVLEEEIGALEIEVSLIEDVNLFIPPVFSNTPSDFMIEYGDEIDLLGLGLQAFDNIDQDVTSGISVNIDDTSVLTIGKHVVTYEVSDSDGNSTSTTSIPA